MKLAFLDCISGISGDMLLAAFLDLGWDLENILGIPDLLRLQGVDIAVSTKTTCGISAQHIDIKARHPQPLRKLNALLHLVETSALSDYIKARSLAVLKRIGEAEAKIHGCSISEIHFHEIGAVDTLIDITGTLLALQALSIEKVFSSPLPLSRGLVKCSHGLLPLPAPAVLELLKGVPVYHVDVDEELVTPTGAALAKEITSAFGPMPRMKILQTGYGAGSKDLSPRPNVLRIVTGQRLDETMKTETISQLRTVIDDSTPEQLAHLLHMTMARGALDAWITPVVMKKSRSAFEFTAICPPEIEEKIARCIFTESSTIGLRIEHPTRLILPRKPITIWTPWGEVEAKLIERPDGRRDIVPEFTSCKKIAEKYDVPLRVVYSTVSRAEGGRKE